MERWWRKYGTSNLPVIRQAFRARLTQLQAYRHKRIVYALILTNFTSVLLFGMRLIGAENFRYWFMLWNLTLAWAAPLVAWWIVVRLKRTRWRTWPNSLLTLIWLGFLPNSFYMVSDLIHVQQTGEVSIIFDAVLFTSFIFNGFIAGYLSLFLLHRELLKRYSTVRSYVVLTAVFLLCGFAIYLGRVQRWNTWDAVFSPAGLIFDVSDILINPLAHPQAFLITISFMLIVGVFYVLAWEVFQSWHTREQSVHRSGKS